MLRPAKLEEISTDRGLHMRQGQSALTSVALGGEQYFWNDASLQAKSTDRPARAKSAHLACLLRAHKARTEGVFRRATSALRLEIGAFSDVKKVPFPQRKACQTMQGEQPVSQRNEPHVSRRASSDFF